MACRFKEGPEREVAYSRSHRRVLGFLWGLDSGTPCP